MRFYVLSDLHLRNDNLVYAKKVLKELCESIKQVSVNITDGQAHPIR